MNRQSMADRPPRKADKRSEMQQEEEKEKKEEEFDKLFNYNRQSIQNLLITTFNEKWFCNRTT